MPLKKVVLARYLVQFISLVSFVLLLADLSYPLGLESLVLQWFSRLDPWLLLSHLRWQQEITLWAWLPFLTLASTLLWGRIFCGWLCPFGALLALTDKSGRAVCKKVSLLRSKVLYAAQSMRIYWLFFLAVIFFLGSNWVFFFTPFALFSHEIVRILTGHIPWLLLVIMAVTLVFSRLWCSVLCPTGALLSLIARLRFFAYGSAPGCINCEKCSRTCAVGTAPAYSDFAQDSCLVCGDCQRICPTEAIKWQRNSWWHKKSQLVLADNSAVIKNEASRRNFFKMALAVTAAAVLWNKLVWAAEKYLRPPGALPEAEFTAVCNRCGRCIQVCPSKALLPMPITDGLVNFETPYLIPRQNHCDLCLACQKVCPTGAIAEIPPEKIRIGRAVIAKPHCLAWSDGKMCYICGEQCPVLAIKADAQKRPIVIPDKCVGCGACENACPVDGEAAIRVFPN